MMRDIILDSIADGVFTVDGNWRITSFNRAAETITGVPREEAIGQRCRDVLKADICEKNCCLEKTMRTGEQILNKTVNIVNASGVRVPISISTALLKDGQGAVMGAVETFRDLSVEERLRKTLTETYSFEDVLSKNPRMQECFQILPDVPRATARSSSKGKAARARNFSPVPSTT
jgi:PAS domain S-box-containing protein